MRISNWLRPRWMTTGQCMLLSMGIVAIVSLTSGCGPTLMDKLNQTAPFRLSESIPPFKLDSSASLVIYDGNDSPSEAEADQVRGAVSRLLATRYGQRGVTPARFRLRIQVDYKWWPAVACIDLQLLGCPTGYTNANVTLDLQVGDKFFIGHGQATGIGGLYYNHLTGVDSAVGEAIGNATASLFPL